METGDPPGNVVVVAANNPTTGIAFSAGFLLNTNIAVSIDGFVIYGAQIGIYVKTHSDQVRLTNNIVSASVVHGIYVQDSANVLVFNNLSYANGSSGIILRGSPGALVINNTSYGNADRGIFFAAGSTGGAALDNALEANVTAGIQTDELAGYVTGGNVSSDHFASGTPKDATDLGASVVSSLLFVDPTGADGVLGGVGYADDDFRLSQIAAGQTANSPAVDAGSDLARYLRLARASTRTDGLRDTRWVDAGYHYGNFLSPPPRPTRRIRSKPIVVDPQHGDDNNDGATVHTAFRTLAHALSVARAGNRVELLPGTYSEGLVSPAQSGTPDRNVVIQPVSSPVVIDANGLADALLISGRSNIRIVGLDVINASSAGIEIRDGASNITIDRCHIYQNGQRGVYATGASGVIIMDSTISGNGDDGVRQVGGTLEFIGSDVSGNHGNGIAAEYDGRSVSARFNGGGQHRQWHPSPQRRQRDDYRDGVQFQRGRRYYHSGHGRPPRGE